jgi:Ca-activated chloride channel family protein
MKPAMKAATDRRLVPPTGATRYLAVTITAPQADDKPRPPVNLGLVLDRSGSMGGPKIRTARQAVAEALGRLEPRDRFSVVAYDQEVDVVVPATAATPHAVRQATERVLAIQARGNTDLCGGWLRGCDQVASAGGAGSIAKVLLLTDGLANQGTTDPAEIKARVADLRARGITTSTIGVGDDFDEQLLGAMADVGGGNFHYVDRDQRIATAIGIEVGETLEVTLPAAQLRLTADGPVALAPLAAFPVRNEGADVIVELGNLVSSQELVVVLAAELPALTGRVVVTASLESGDRVHAMAQAGWLAADDAACAAQERDVAVDRAAAEVLAALARREAAALNRAGEFGGAGDRIRAAADRVHALAGDDPELMALAAELDEEEGVYRERFSAPTFKARYMASYSSLKGRTRFGGTDRAAGAGLATIGIVAPTAALAEAARRAIAPRHGHLLPPTVGIVVHDESALRGRKLGGPVLNEVLELRLAIVAKKLGGDTVTIVLADQELPGGHFAHWHDRYAAAVATTVPWEKAGTWPEPWIAALLLEIGPRAWAPSYVPLASFHAEGTDCMLDFGRTAAALHQCMRAGTLCRACRDRLANEGRLGEALVEDVARHIRELCGCRVRP